MTNREFLTAVIAIENLSADLKEFAENEIVKLDNRNAKRAEKPSKRAVENEPIKAEILRVIADKDKVMTASDLMAEMDGYTVQKLSSLCVQLVKEGKLEVVEVKVKGKGKQKGYSVVEAEVE